MHPRDDDGYDSERIPPHEAMKYFEQLIAGNTKPKEEPIPIGQYKAEFQDDGSVRVGCEEIEWETIERIYGRACRRKSRKGPNDPMAACIPSGR